MVPQPAGAADSHKPALLWASFFQSKLATCMLKSLWPWISSGPLRNYLVYRVRNIASGVLVMRNGACLFPGVWHKGRGK